MFDNPHLPDDRTPHRGDSLYDSLTPDAFYLVVGESTGEEFDDPFAAPLTDPAPESS